ncbi:MAG: type IV secretory system conjugative DNA transfer family protein [Geminicoccaceae bacterium]
MFLHARFTEHWRPWRPFTPLYRLRARFKPNHDLTAIDRLRKFGGYRLGRLCRGIELSSYDLGELVRARDEIDKGLDHIRPRLALDLPPSMFQEHGHIMAGIGHGKSVLIQKLVAGWLRYVEAGELSVVVIDSQRDLIRDLSGIKAVTNGPLGARTMLLDGSATPAPSISPFSRPARWAAYGSAHAERIATASTDALIYAISALFGDNAMTPIQTTLLVWALRALAERPNPTIGDLMTLLEVEALSKGAKETDTVTSRKDIKNPATRRFFEELPLNSRSATTASELKTRLYGVMAKPAIARLFDVVGAKVDLFDAMVSGTFVLVDTAKDALGSMGASLYGRLIIAMLSNAINERLALPKDQRKPCIIMIDECADYLAGDDQLLIELLTQARKANVGIILAHQHLGQLSPEVAAAILGNVSCKIYGALSYNDQGRVAPEIKWTSNELSLLRKAETMTLFALWSKAHGPRAIKCGVPLASIGSVLPQSNRDDIEAWRKTNRERVTA